MRLVMFTLAALAASLACNPAYAKIKLPPPVVVPAVEPGAEMRPFALARIVLRLTPGQVVGFNQKGLSCSPFEAISWSPGLLEVKTADFEQTLYSEARQAGFPSMDENLFEPTASKAEFAVAAAVTNAEVEVCNPFTGFDNLRERGLLTGAALIEVEWQVYSTLERRVVAKIQTKGGVRIKNPATNAFERMLYGAFGENAKELLASPEFRQAITVSASQATKAAVPKFEPFTPLRLAVDKAAKPAGIAGAMSSVVLILAPSGHGSGFLVSTDGHILTNQHVVMSAREVRIRWSDGSETRGVVERTDKWRDVALIKTDPGARKPLLFRTTPPVVGETVLAVGAPLDAQFQGTVTRGIVSTPNRMFEGLRYVQSDVMVNRGNSGGPLLDEQGRVLAITDLGYTGGQEGPTGINLFVPIDDAARYLNAFQ